jgi:hypothetical protein
MPAPTCSKCGSLLIPSITQTGKGNWCDRCRIGTPAPLGKVVDLNRQADKDWHRPDKMQDTPEPVQADQTHPIKPVIVEAGGEVVLCLDHVSIVLGKSDKKGLHIRRLG